MKVVLKAIAEFQQECPVIHKDTKGFNYTYADLTQILKVINPLLKKHGLGFIQPLHETSIKTIVFHVESGETIESITEIPQGVKLGAMNDFQVMGSAITYLRRYSLSSLLGLVTDKDIDATGKQTVIDYTKQLEDAKTLVELSKVWVSIPKSEQGKYLILKDKLKGGLK